MDIKIKLEGKQQLRLSLGMQKALHVLQLPLPELTEWLKAEIEQNPLLELSEERCSKIADSDEEPREIDFEHPDFSLIKEADFLDAEEENESPLIYKPTLFEHLMQQARHASFSDEELKIAEQVIGQLDERGFLSDVPTEWALVVKKIQLFEPPGIAAKNLRESLLLQLELKDKSHTLAYQIVDLYFEEMLHNRLPQLQKKLKCTIDHLQKILKEEISILTFHPASTFTSHISTPITADIILKREDDKWRIEINQETLPYFKITSLYPPMTTSEEKQYVHHHMEEGRWLKKILERRYTTLQSIAHKLVERQGPYLAGDSNILSPLTMQELAIELGLSESTVGRAIAHKYLFSPRGVLSLRTLFTHAMKKGGELSSHTVKEQLKRMIEKEDKRHPLTDQALALSLTKNGSPISRRAVSKYRQLLHIAGTTQRRRWQ